MKRTILFLCASFACVSCAGFIKADGIAELKKFEENVYALKADAGTGDRLLKKGEQVRLLVITGKDSIRVYGCRASVDPLKAHRILLIQLFEDSFPGEKFEMGEFRKHFDEKLAAVRPQDVKKVSPGYTEKSILGDSHKERTEEMRKNRAEEARKGKPQPPKAMSR